MKRIFLIPLLFFAMVSITPGQAKRQTQIKGILLEDLTWIEAEKILTPDTVVVIPLGAESKEHGPHLKLKNDFLRQEEGGTHADEIETSMMLYMAPASVNMKKAVKDYHGNAPGGLTRKPGGSGVYSPTGIWGDPTLATREKGRRVTEALITEILKEIEDLRQTPVSTSTVR